MTGTAHTTQEGRNHALSAISYDPDVYRPMLKGSGMTPEQERQFLDALWSIVVSFADLGFGLNPLQDVMPNTTTVEDKPARVISSPGISDIFNSKTDAETTHAPSPVREDS